MAATVVGQENLFVVAFLPFRILAQAARADSVHMVGTCRILGVVLRMYAIVAFKLVGLRHPYPPRIMRTSRSGAVSNVCVGVRDGYTEKFSGFIAAFARTRGH